MVETLKATLPKVEGRPITLQRFTLAQMKEKRDKGLCFKCESKWALTRDVEDQEYF